MKFYIYRLSFSLLIVLSISFRSYAQENHYWTNQFGPTSIFLGGAVVGGVKDNSSIFYNPASADFSSFFNVSLQTNEVYNQNLYVKNGAGTNIHVHNNRWEAIPQIWSLSFGSKKRPNWRTSFGIMTSSFSNIRFRARNEVKKDIYPNIPGEEIYIGSWYYGNRNKEDMFAVSFTNKMSERFSVGLTTFLTFKTYEFSETEDQSVSKTSDVNSNDYLRYVSRVDNLDGTISGIMLKLGLSYEINTFKIGLTITSPRAQLSFFRKMNYYSSRYSYFTQADSNLNSPNYTILLNQAYGIYKSPLIIDFGVMKNIFDTDIYLRVTYFSGIDSYNMITPYKPKGLTKAIIEANPSTANVILANKKIFNVSIGWHRNISKSFSLLAGFRTDFNYIDDDKLTLSDGISPQLSYWDLFHLSAGTTINILKNKFTVGLTYSGGRKSGQLNFVNLTTPQEGEIFNDLEANASAFVDQLGINIGWVYNFNSEM